ncbi:MAG: hypothetical protein DHS20C16_27920 [Phycisphaerae bacterium]|nr:MAG: hypothetical protein DHS20C16_27920 [Phycisphaerae bacterium]
MERHNSNDVDLFLRRALVVVLIVLLTGTVLLFVYANYFTSRLDTFEQHLKYQDPPESIHEPEPLATGDQTSPGSESKPVQGQTIYVPAYSHVYHLDGDPHLLTVTLSIRNTSIDHEIIIKSVRYFDTQGKEVKSHLAKPLRLRALATAEFLVKRSDISGGSGANFLVEWVSNQPVSNPVAETVMIDTSRDQGISFVRSGTVIKEITPQPN